MLDEPENDVLPLVADRFERRRADIISAAIPVLNGHGFKGMRLTAIAELIGLRATGVTYYFPPRKSWRSRASNPDSRSSTICWRSRSVSRTPAPALLV